MIVKLLDGKSLAKATEESISKQVDELNNNGISPTLANILVGQDPASETYVKMKRNTCARVGMKSIAVEMSDSTTTEELLKKIQNEYGLTYLFISHDLKVIRSMSDFIFVMKNGEIVESGPSHDVFEKPEKEYTKKLLNAALKYASE